ncbi:UDP-N-acetylglucosamine 2-epimerase (hydrolyzing) [Lysinibacillus sphaericus]|uniref:UDP-N-acetylglucosamine 2-epimerase n=3 Tax=Lysinibacillus TaxID=400634 RepID=W7RRJ8_LYSSH|nr:MULTISPECIES: UDP-N-acetylglucosamine 2-epimerase [Lysinibacillus]MBE5084771.1 UDP-N-acetylglucosamine 2-epimerase (hydrolyzing) [Bacillus thuringiensis]ACA38772.1 Polysialic acid biosynthesis protein P7 [Lysinibacillus sphaericus C3-41]AMO34972.1 UDP-N-acetyl glucosamine 2-epimerase [Lysinibacillus sphaericus]AMR89913.1 UDP-N-acetyl glucosamine 2-epimerase [Lysinibacillus sphaericus]ANA47983.1 UDP-N-acetyl glucosamine 2-epimerase [Lysinibacillus sphaericus]
MKRKICIVTGTRAEYGLLSNIANKIRRDEAIDLQMVVTGMHLSPEFGSTYKEIENDGFFIDEKIEILLSADSSTGIVKSIGLAAISFADAFNRLQPDLLIILGDRFEMLAAAQTALIMQIPIAHIHGGECTFGAYDDAIRHSITKMATWHFTSTESHRKRVIQLGESPERVFNVGALGIENIVNLNLLTRQELFQKLQLDEQQPMFLITYHPETNGHINGIYELLKSLENYSDINLVFTKSNADNGGRLINEAIQQFILKHSNAKIFDSLGQLKYLSAVKNAEVVIGNSSSGLIEVPYLETPTVNCGNRQEGREHPNSVFNTKMDAGNIYHTIEKARKFSDKYEHLFGDGKVSEKIMTVLRSLPSFSIQKGFYDL